MNRRPNDRRLRLAAGGGTVLALLVAAVVLHGASRAPAPGPSGSPGATAHPGGNGIPGTADDARRVADILQTMHTHAFNPAAPLSKGASGPAGGLFINWTPSWDGNLDSAGQSTNINTNGLTDDAEGKTNSRHDPITDVQYLHNLLGYRAAHPADHSFDADVAEMEPIVRAEYANYSAYRAWIYGLFRDMDGWQPGQGWDRLATVMVQNCVKRYDQASGTILDKSHAATSYRVDWAAQCGAALLDTGARTNDAAMTRMGSSTIAHLLAHARNPTTHLFPLEMAVAQGQETPKQAIVKLGAEAQLVDSFVSAYDVTHDPATLAAVQAALDTIYNPATGLHDTKNGGFYYAVDWDGTNVRQAYKESRQAWMLVLLAHLEKDQPGRWTAQLQEMTTVVRDRLWRTEGGGYAYRVEPDFSTFQGHTSDHATVQEDFISTEASNIAAQALEALPTTAATQGSTGTP